MSAFAALDERYRRTGANLPFGDPRPSHGAEMEGYFLRVTDVPRRRVLVVLCGVNRHPDGDWATVAIAAHPGQFVRSAVLSGASAAADRFLVTAGDGAFTATEHEVHIDLGGDARADLSLHQPVTWPRVLGGVQIELDPTRAGARIATDVPLVGDAADTLRALLPLLDRKADRGFLEDAQQAMVKWRDDMGALENSDRDPIQPQYLMRVIDRLADDDAILCSDSGTIATWAARHFDIRGDRQFYLSGNLATMAPGLPYALAAQWAHPGRQCIAFVGDGGFAMLMAELLAAVRYQLPVKVVICNRRARPDPVGADGPRLSRTRRALPGPGQLRRLGGSRRLSRHTGRTAGRPGRRGGCRVRPSGAGGGRRRGQPRRTPDAGQGHLRAGQGVRRVVPAGPAAKGHHRFHPPAT